MSLNSHSSAGVYTNEYNLSQYVAAATVSIGAIVGVSNKGPVMERTLITSVKQFLEVFGNPDPRTSYMHYCAMAFLTRSSRLYVTRVISRLKNSYTAGAYLTVDQADAVTPVLELTNFDAGARFPRGIYDPFRELAFSTTVEDPATENVLGFICALNPGAWNNTLYVRVRPSTKAGRTTPEDPTVFWVDVFNDYKGTRDIPLESFLVSRDVRRDGFNNQMNIEEVINNRSRYIRVKTNPYSSNKVKILNVSGVLLEGATNGTLATEGQVELGWELYRDVEACSVNILIQGGFESTAVQTVMDDICQTRGDCIAVLDQPMMKQAVGDCITYREETLNLDTSHSAIYSPDVLIRDTLNDRELYIPPSGHVAAAYAYTDEVAETWFAPAGMSRGHLNILGVRETYNQGDRDALADSQVNAIRVIPGSGYKIWGADTLASMPSALSNVNVRRLLNFIKKSLGIAALYSVFSPNDEILRASLKEMVERFLKPIKAGRGLYDFSVVCDESNNPPEVIGTGDTSVDVFLDPVLPAKRIHLNAIVTKTGANFKELASARTLASRA